VEVSYLLYSLIRNLGRRKTTPHEAHGTNSPMGVLFLRVLDEGT